MESLYNIIIQPANSFYRCNGKCEENIHILESALTMHNNIRCLSTIEPRWHFSMLLLTLVTPSGGFTLAGRGTATSSDPLIVGSGGVGEGA